ncbi:MAG: hypothetical protein KKB51_24825 [Candidatus Riflebacteria bacterium]|nr:hypothetical protein [Candidatus Riflebacteria bacterium]
MGVTFKKEEAILVFILDGENTINQAEKAFRQALGNPDEIDTFSVLIDARTSSRHRDLSEVSSFAEFLITYKGRIRDKCALVIDEKRPKSLELERRLAGFSIREKIEFGLFYDIESAKSWLEQQ